MTDGGVAQASESLLLAAATAGGTSRGGGDGIVVDVRDCLTQANGYSLTNRESAVGEKPGLGNSETSRQQQESQWAESAVVQGHLLDLGHELRVHFRKL